MTSLGLKLWPLINSVMQVDTELANKKSSLPKLLRQQPKERVYNSQTYRWRAGKLPDCKCPSIRNSRSTVAVHRSQVCQAQHSASVIWGKTETGRQTGRNGAEITPDQSLTLQWPLHTCTAADTTSAITLRMSPKVPFTNGNYDYLAFMEDKAHFHT